MGAATAFAPAAGLLGRLTGLRVSAEATPHHFTLTDAAVASYDTVFKVNPPLRTDDGRVVSVVHIVAELAPFARTGGLGEAVKSLAEFQCASEIPTAIIMPLYRQVERQRLDLWPVEFLRGSGYADVFDLRSVVNW